MPGSNNQSPTSTLFNPYHTYHNFTT